MGRKCGGLPYRSEVAPGTRPTPDLERISASAPASGIEDLLVAVRMTLPTSAPRLGPCIPIAGASEYVGVNMPASIDTLILDLLEWLDPRHRAYAEVMDAWRTSCPRLPVWEDANERGFIECHWQEGGERLVSVSPIGRAFLDAHRPQRDA